MLRKATFYKIDWNEERLQASKGNVLAMESYNR